MQSIIRALVVSLAALLLLAPGALAASARSGSAHVAQVKMDRLTISITTTSGTVWGKVTVRYTRAGHTVHTVVSAPKTNLQVPQGMTVRLSQTAMSSTTWPFQAWKLHWGSHSKTVTHASTTVKMTTNMSVKVVYILAQSQPSSTPQPYPTYTYP